MTFSALVGSSQAFGALALASVPKPETNLSGALDELSEVYVAV